MKKLFFFMAFGVVALLLPVEAEAVGRQCPLSGSDIDITSDHEVGDAAAMHTCTTDAVGMSYTFKALGVCDGFPDYQNGLQNCFTVFNENVDVDLLTTNTAVTASGFMPPAGTYDHFFAITGNELKVRGQLDFTQDYLSLGASFDIDEGANCYPDGSYKTSIITSVDAANPVTSLQGLTSGLPIKCGSSAQEGQLTVEIDNVGLTSYSSTLNIDNYNWVSGVDEDSDVNVILLDSVANVAANGDAVQDVLFTKKAASALTITSGTDFNVSFSKDDALQLYYLCDPQLAETINGLIAGTVANNGSDCMMMGVTLGENAFTPNITITD